MIDRYRLDMYISAKGIFISKNIIDGLHCMQLPINLSSTFLGTLDTKLDNHTDFLVLVDDIWKATVKIQKNVGGINETQQIMRGKSSCIYLLTFELCT